MNNQKKNDVINLIKQWMACDNKIKTMQSEMKLEKKSKKEFSEQLISVMKENEIECFDTKSGKLAYTTTKRRQCISKKYLRDILSKYCEGINEADEITNYILDNRKESMVELIKFHK